MCAMNVKWDKRILKGPSGRERYQLHLVLVENYQEEGKTRERLVDHLGAIEERFLNSHVRDVKAFHQGLFWATVDKKLDRLKLDAGIRNKIEAEILKLVSKPTGEWALWAVTCVPKFDT
jgi:hypothetical protein